MDDLAAQLVAFARATWPQWGVMMTELEKRGVDANAATLAVRVLRDHAHLGTAAINWPEVEGDIRAILAPIPPEPGPPGEGWFNPPVASDARVVYVAADGDDGDAGLSAAFPVRTIGAAKQRIRDGLPDRILLRAGDAFAGLVRWEHSGRSAEQPAVFGVYGEGPRPILAGGMIAMGNAPINHVAFLGLDFAPNPAALPAPGQPGDDGVRWLVPGVGIYFEDCRVDGGTRGLVIQAKVKATVRRCIVRDCTDNGAYCDDTDALLVTETCMDNNGNPPNTRVHDLYCQANTRGVVVNGSIFTNGGSHGAQMRGGGECSDSLFISPIGLLMGGGDKPNVDGVTAIVKGNVILGGGNIDASNERGWGFQVMNVKGGSFAGNVLADGVGGMLIPLSLDGAYRGDLGTGFQGVRNFLISGNVRRAWPCISHPDTVPPGYLRKGTPAQLAGTSVVGMEDRADLAGIDIQPDTFSLGMLLYHRNRGRAVWDEAKSAKAYCAWVRERFSMATP